MITGGFGESSPWVVFVTSNQRVKRERKIHFYCHALYGIFRQIMSNLVAFNAY